MRDAASHIADEHAITLSVYSSNPNSSPCVALSLSVSLVGHDGHRDGGYISVLTNHVMNMVLPKMMSDLGTDVVTICWVVTRCCG